MKIIDLSVPVRTNPGEPVPVTVKLTDHVEGAEVLGAVYGLTADDFPDGYAISTELVTLSTHCGTHIDAPLHYGPHSEGKSAKSIDELPLEFFFAQGLLLRFDSDPQRGPVSADEVAAAVERHNLTSIARRIVLLDVGAAEKWSTKEYFTSFRGIAPEAVEYLINQGVKVIGTDAFGFDQPFGNMLKNWRKTGSKDVLWPTHILGRKREYFQIERLAGLDQLPDDIPFNIACFPIRLAGCGAAWTRAVAILEDCSA
ncbi:cyclase family protein [Acetobacteraceae bacterium ESL0709]|nr:cyclase family protein [Acetobacteraceae bacterium ESL0697]MDF7679064.1 cyclase family protein [Acetobacteraceae bacterium ESL0709]